MENKKCYICNKIFTPKSFNQVVCTNVHYFSCPICNKEFIPSKQQIRNFINTGKVGGCSSKCVSQIGLQTKINKYGKGNNGDKIKETYKSMSKELKQQYVDKAKHTKLKRYGDENYNNISKNKHTKLKRYGDENYNNREKMIQTVLTTNNGVFRTEEQNNKMIQTKINKYGKGNNGDKISLSLKNKTKEQKEQIKLKTKQTKLKKYNNKNYNNSKKMLQTKLEKYGSSSYNNIDKIKQTNMERYGVKNTYQISSVKEKTKQTNMERYGCDNPFKSIEVQKQIQEKLQQKYNGIGMGSHIIKQKIQNTNLKRYGNKCCFGNKQVRLKINNTMNKKYNRNYINQTNYSELTYKILNDKNLLTNFIESIPYNERKADYVADKLQISKTSLYVYLRKYQISTNDILNHSISSLELEIKQFLDTLNINYQTHVRNIIYPYELDFYIPEHKVAIECNGTYWHSELILQDKNYHYNKSKMCEEEGVRLIHIYEYEWENKRQKPILQNIIKNALNLCEHNIYARKCDIKVIENTSLLREFFDNNNIQGFRGGKFAICLEYNNEIVMSYIFGHPYFGKGKYEVEVIRGATKLNTNVIGGASKIWKYFIDNYDYNNCVYYIDYNYFNGNSLRYLLNMSYIKTQPSFKNYFINTGIVKNRDPLHHKEIKEMYKTGKVLQVYNAGTKVYVWNRNI